jgi:hypothetical protein
VLTTNQKGAIAEAAITKAAVELGLEVYRPAVEGGRYDLIFASDRGLTRVQCKWARLYGDVIIIRCYPNRRARAGLVRRLYTTEEIDAFAVYCAELDACYFLPFAEMGGGPQFQLRIAPTRNNQRSRINWARDYEFGAKLRPVLGP